MRRVTALGSADAFNSAGRGHTCWLIEDAHGLAAVDFGATALMSLKKLGRDPGELDAVHFTHLHGDHIGGWPFLLVDAVYRLKRTRPLLASGPPGTRDRLQALWAACYARAAERPLPFPLEVHELQPGESALLAGREVRAFAAQHMTPPDIALSLRIGDLAFTGDTGVIPDGLTDGAKLLCAECTYLSGRSDRHLSWDNLARLQIPMLLAHLGDEARNGLRSREGVVVCDDLTTWIESTS
jgi:ribonuclease BN (tRNA processing enzyme)